jgi:polar amino acid transport system substrate-binding protein
MPILFKAFRQLPTCTLVAALSIAAVALSAQAPPLKLVSTAWSPFTNAPGQARFALDLVETALGRINVTATTTIVEASEFTPLLLRGPYDGSAAAWKDAERESVLLFSQPYLENRLILVGRKGADVKASTLGALKGKRIAIVGGYAYGDIEGAGPVFVRSQSEEDSLTQLLQSKVDYTLMDELVVQYILSNYAKEAKTRLELGVTPMVTRPLFFAVRRSRPDAESLISRFNLQLRGLIADRTYHKLLHLDWIRADIDGDGVMENVPFSDKAGTACAAARVFAQAARHGPHDEGDSAHAALSTWAAPSTPTGRRCPTATRSTIRRGQRGQKYRQHFQVRLVAESDRPSRIFRNERVWISSSVRPVSRASSSVRAPELRPRRK